MDKKELAKYIKELIEEDRLDKFYKTKEFKELRKRCIEKANHECQECKKHGVITPGTVAHHIKFVRTHPELALEESNIQVLCNECHNKIHSKPELMLKHEVIVVTGLPGSGKTTHVKKYYNNKFDIVYDLDTIQRAITYNHPNKNSLSITNRLLESFLDKSRNLRPCTVWIIRTSPNEKELQLFKSNGAKFVEINYNNIEECKKLRANITEDEWKAIEMKHNIYLKMKDEPKEEDRFKERW